jgi:hypothetical protein
MTRIYFSTTATLMLLIGIYLASTVAGAPADAKAGKVFRHVVLFKFKDGTTPEQVKEVVDAFRALKDKVDAIADFEYGTDVSTENRAQGFTHCFFVTFRDDKGRDAYLPHPAHKAFGALVGPRLDKVLVVDYWTEH